MYNRSILCFLVCDGQSGVVTRGTGDRLRETKFLILTGSRNRKGSTPSRATWGSLLGVRSQKAGGKGKPKPEPALGIPQERQGREGEMC